FWIRQLRRHHAAANPQMFGAVLPDAFGIRGELGVRRGEFFWGVGHQPSPNLTLLCSKPAIGNGGGPRLISVNRTSRPSMMFGTLFSGVSPLMTAKYSGLWSCFCSTAAAIPAANAWNAS